MTTRHASRLLRGLLLLGAAMGLTLTTGCGMIDAMDGIGTAKDLQETGVPATAKILSIEETGMEVNDVPVVRLEVEVHPDGQPPFQATIKRLPISPIHYAQFQPGAIIGVRYDPRDPSRISYDLGPKHPATKTGNPFIDNFTPEKPTMAMEPPPPAPALYRGSLDDTADVRALEENGYEAIGEAEFQGVPPDVAEAADQGRRIGASIVVVYGENAGDARLDKLPFQPREAVARGVGEPAAAIGGAAPSTIGTLPPPPREDHTATYWAKAKRPILGISYRALDEQEQTRLLRKGGAMVVSVVTGSPAAAAGLQGGDLIVAMDGKPILDANAVDAFLQSVAGRSLRLDILRNGSPLTLTAQLNPPAP